jgi:hypothetical protein
MAAYVISEVEVLDETQGLSYRRACSSCASGRFRGNAPRPGTASGRSISSGRYVQMHPKCRAEPGPNLVANHEAGLFIEG